MIPSLHDRFRDAGSPLALAWLSSPDPLAAEALARVGFDAVVVDQQHGAIDDAQALALLQAVTAAGRAAIVRVAWNAPHLVMKALDLGAWGVIAPMLEGVDDVRAFVAACRYPPQGVRSFGPTRGAALAGDDYAARANDEVVPIAMIETRAALEQIDDIVRVPGLGAVFVGPADLSQALGGPPGVDFVTGPVPEALARIAASAAAAGVPAGLYTRDPAYAARMASLGYRFAALGGALDLMTAAAAGALARYRQVSPD